MSCPVPKLVVANGCRRKRLTCCRPLAWASSTTAVPSRVATVARTGEPSAAVAVTSKGV